MCQCPRNGEARPGKPCTVVVPIQTRWGQKLGPKNIGLLLVMVTVLAGGVEVFDGMKMVKLGKFDVFMRE